MESEDFSREVVDPEVRAHVYSLVSAVGGTSGDEDGRYVLGDDALACLKDLKRWLKLYDEKMDRMDVARCLGESNLVNGDLLEILAAWPEDATDDRIKSKIALACLELLVPLTWPIEKTDLNITVNHHRHIPYLQLAQVNYKRGILEHDTTKILRTVVRIALPSLAQPMSERSSRDEGIIRLLLYFVRNVTIISPPPNLYYDGNEQEVSRSATIKAFHEQEILHLLLTIGSGMGEEFNTQDVVLLEVLFHLLKGVDVEKLFMNDTELVSSNSDELRQLMNKEAGMHRDYLRRAPTRHNRFGTMLWVKRAEERYSTVSGQDALIDGQRTLAKLDESKKWKRPGKRKPKETEMVLDDFNTPVTLTPAANRQLRHFVEDFLDSAFNPLFSHLRKAIEREADRVVDHHTRQYFYLVSWFLKAHRERSIVKSARAKKQGIEEVETDKFGIIASVLNQETFITLNRFLDSSYDKGDWGYVNAGMRCFTQILLTVQDMSESPVDEDQEIADNIQSRIFYEEATHDRVVSIIRTYKNQGFGYLDACTELAHVHLRVLERYSKENIDLQIRSKRRRRKKKQAEKRQIGIEMDENDDENDEADDLAQAQITSSERRFDFHRFCVKFMSQNCVDTFVAFAKFYQELSAEQLKRIHRFLYRAAFKMEMGVMLFRVDIIALLVKMIKGPDGLDRSASHYNEWFELVTQLIKRLTRKIEERPEMVVEMLFSKINATVFYLEHGHERQVISSTPKPPAELEVKPGMDKGQQIGIVVSILIDQNKSDALSWIYRVLSSAITERETWEAEATARRMLEAPRENEEGQEPEPEVSTAPSIIVMPDTPQRKTAMFKDGRLRLLMTLVGMQRIGLFDDLEASWIFPSSISSEELKENLDAARNAEFAPPSFDEDKSAEDFIRRKLVPKIRAAYDDDDEEGRSSGDDDFLFPAGGPTDRPKSDALAELKKKRRSRISNTEEMTEEERRERALERERANLEKLKKIKSTLRVHDSDDEDDEERDREFFEKEEKRRHAQKENILTISRNGGNEMKKPKKGSQKKRKSDAIDLESSKRQKSPSSDISDEDDDRMFLTGSSSVHLPSDPLDENTGNDTETPMSSPPKTGAKQKDQDGSSEASEDDDESQQADLQDVEMAEDIQGSAEILIKSQIARRKRNTLLIDSSDEE